jgi:hypothetical protein
MPGRPSTLRTKMLDIQSDLENDLSTLAIPIC